MVIEHEAPANEAAHQAPHNLPLPLAPLLGRDRELAAVGVRLRAPGTRLLTLTGVGGVGKTRLALAAAEAALARFPDGAWLVSLAPLQDPTLLAGAVAQALGVREAGGGSLEDQLVEHLRARRLLLVLDNCEHLLDTCAALVGTLLAGCPLLRVLATSRAPLRLSGEQRLPVPPLGLPAEDDAVVEALAAVPAVALFVARARAVEPGFTLDAGNSATVAHICRRLDGLPLALELAAARIKARTPAALLEELGERLHALAAGSRQHEARQRTLHALLDWSYTLLGAGEQALFARLSAFAGGWTLAVAAAVCPIEDDLPFSMAEGLASLAEQSMVQGPDAAGRYGMLETVREYAGYALVRLAAAEDGERVRQQHAGYFLALAEEAEPALQGPEQARWLPVLQAEQDNLRRALGWAREREDGALALRLACAIGPFWQLIGNWAECERMYQQALALATPDDDRQLVARCCLLLGHLQLFRADYAEALVGLEQARVEFEQCADQRGMSRTIGCIGLVYLEQGDQARARDHFEQQARIAADLGDQAGLAEAVGRIGTIYAEQGDYARALECSERQLALATAIGDRRESLYAVGNMGAAYQLAGDYSRALAQYSTALAMAAELGDQWSIMAAANNMGEVYQLQGAYAQALVSHQFTLRTALQLEDRKSVMLAMWNIAQTQLEQGIAVEDLLAKAIALARALNNLYHLVDMLYRHAEQARRRGDYAEAVAAADEVARIAAQVERKDMQLKAQLLLIAVRVAAGEIDRTAAVGDCEALLRQAPEASAEAAIGYALWRMTEREDQRQYAAALYRQLYARTPNIDYRRRLEELTGEPSEDPPALPPLPALMTHNLVPLDELIAQVDELIAASTPLPA